MFKFIHCADIHLDSPMKGLGRYAGAPEADLRDSTRKALVALVDLAIDEKVAFVVIAGDLYDGDWHDHGTGLFLNQQAARLRDHGIAVYLIRGNHDAASQITRHLAPPDNVHMLPTDQATTLIDDDLGVAIHGQGYATRAVTTNLAAAYPARRPGYFNLGILHTCVTGRDGHEAYAPCKLEELRTKDYHYWALGHIHQREELHTDPPIVFAGNLQGRHARETGAKGCELITVDGGRIVKREQRVLDVVRWSLCKVSAAGVHDLEDLAQRAAEEVANQSREAGARILAARVELVGPCPIHDRLHSRREDFEAAVRNGVRDLGRGSVWVEKVQIHTKPQRQYDRDDGPIGEVARLLAELKGDDQRLIDLASSELAELKRKLPSELRHGADSVPLEDPEALRRVLDQVGSLLIEGLLDVEDRR